MVCISSIQFSSLDRWGRRGNTRDDSSEILFPVFSAGGPRQQFRNGQGCPLFGVHPAFPLPTTASPTLQGALKDGFGEAVVAFDIFESCKFPSPDSFQKRFRWTHKKVDLAPLPVVGIRKSQLLLLSEPCLFFSRLRAQYHEFIPAFLRLLQ